MIDSTHVATASSEERKYRHASKNNFAVGLINDCRSFAIMMLNRWAAKPREVIRVGLPKSAVAQILHISAHLLDLVLSFRTISEILDTPVTAITTP